MKTNFLCVLLAAIPAFDATAQLQSRAQRLPLRDEGVLITHAAQDTSTDTDGDGLADAAEWKLGTNPNSIDTDNDGFGDGWEAKLGFDPRIINKRTPFMYLPRVMAVPTGMEGAEILELSNNWAAGYAWDAKFKVRAARWNLATGAVELDASTAEHFPTGSAIAA
jgi:hypothetical protein